MSKKKQIEEMANDLAQHCPDLVANCCGASSCVSCLTRFLYEAGYRKQRKGEWIDADPDGHLYRFTCSLCGKTKLGRGTPYCPHCGAKMKGGE